ncbi:MAG TPA: hypothetical protein VGC45_00160 [Gryllotalpicola sp.]
MSSEEPGQKHIFMALTNPIEGREDEFNAWYDQEHVPDVVAVECYRSGRRFKLENTAGAPAPWKYLSLYRFEGSVPRMHELLGEASDRHETTMTEAIVDDDGAWIYTNID